MVHVELTLLTLVALTCVFTDIQHYYLVVLYQWINLVYHKSAFPTVQSGNPIVPTHLNQLNNIE